MSFSGKERIGWLCSVLDLGYRDDFRYTVIILNKRRTEHHAGWSFAKLFPSLHALPSASSSSTVGCGHRRWSPGGGRWWRHNPQSWSFIFHAKASSVPSPWPSYQVLWTDFYTFTFPLWMREPETRDSHWSYPRFQRALGLWLLAVVLIKEPSVAKERITFHVGWEIFAEDISMSLELRSPAGGTRRDAYFSLLSGLCSK